MTTTLKNEQTAFLALRATGRVGLIQSKPSQSITIFGTKSNRKVLMSHSGQDHFPLSAQSQEITKAGGDDRFGQDLARDRYHKALQPMKNPNNWELWLARYDEAASYAEKNGVVEVSSLNAIIKDFATAATKVAENWTSNFLDYGRDDPRMTRKEMMRKFRIQMTNRYPNRLQLRNTRQKDASAAPDSAPSIKRGKRTSRTKTNVQIGARYPAGVSSKGFTSEMDQVHQLGIPVKALPPMLDRNFQRVLSHMNSELVGT
ncbi:hypothetical protein E4U59_001055 [Claviceps monticola]|nr:hypothetical protein E4U59_001055 [Claviceps monticola]